MRNSGRKYSVEYTEFIDWKHLRRLPKTEIKNIEGVMRRKLTTAPDLFGKPLHGSLKGYRSLRIGDYRVIFRLAGTTVKILAIDHRSVVYELLERRLKQFGWDVQFPRGSP